MLVAAWVVEAPQTYLYIRDEYPDLRLMLAEEITKVEVANWRRRGHAQRHAESPIREQKALAAHHRRPTTNNNEPGVGD